MKIKRLLSQTITRLKDYHSFIYGSRRPNMQFAERIEYYEQIVSALELKSLIEQKSEELTSLEDLIPFKHFLENRWQRIRKSSLAYPYHSYAPMTHVCLKLAEELASSKYFQIHPLKLLMPSIETYNEVTMMDLSESDLDPGAVRFTRLTQSSSINMNTSTTSNTVTEIHYENPKLELHHFILCDEQKYIIHVLDSLKYAIKDGILKHTSALTAFGKLKPLSESEIKRIELHSLQAKEFHHIIKEYNKIKLNGDSIGAAVNRLILKLRYSGANGGRDGQQSLAGVDSLDGILQFYHFLKELTVDEKEMLYQCSSNNESQDKFKTWWYHLLGRLIVNDEIDIPEEEEFDIFTTMGLTWEHAYPCVEVIGSKLNEILKANPELFNIYPRNKPSTTIMALDVCERELRNLELRLKTALLKHELTHVRVEYDSEGLLKQDVIPYLFSNVRMLKSFFRNVSEIDQDYILRNIIRKYLPELITNADDLNILLEDQNHNFQRLLLDTLGHKFLQQKIMTLSSLKKVIDVLDAAQAIQLLNTRLTKTHWTGFFSHLNDYRFFFLNQPQDKKKKIADAMQFDLKQLEHQKLSFGFWNSNKKRKWDSDEDEDENNDQHEDKDVVMGGIGLRPSPR